jgi:hypothetical protein
MTPPVAEANPLPIVVELGEEGEVENDENIPPPRAESPPALEEIPENEVPLPMMAPSLSTRAANAVSVTSCIWTLGRFKKPAPYWIKTGMVSRTQVLLTKITQLCKEIRDMERTIKTNNIVPRLPESTINTSRNKGSVDGRDIDDPHEKGYNNSSHSSPIPHDPDLSYSINTPQASEEHPTQMPPVPVPYGLRLAPNSSPTSSELTELPSGLSSSDSSELLSVAQ